MGKTHKDLMEDKVYAWIEQHYGLEITHSSVDADLRQLISDVESEELAKYRKLKRDTELNMIVLKIDTLDDE